MKLQITLEKSLIGRKKDQIATGASVRPAQDPFHGRKRG